MVSLKNFLAESPSAVFRRTCFLNYLDPYSRRSSYNALFVVKYLDLAYSDPARVKAKYSFLV